MPTPMETPEQMDERRAQVLEDGCGVGTVALAAKIRASDASAGLVAVPVEDLARALGNIDPILCDKKGWFIRLSETVRAAQGESTT